MNNETYQGWSNRETWAVYLYMGNDETLYNYFVDKAKKEDMTELAATIKDCWEGMVDSLIMGRLERDAKIMLLDVGSLWRVDWYEVAKAFKEAVNE